MTIDPFDALRALDAPSPSDLTPGSTPDAAFVSRLRRELASSLSHDLPTVDLPARRPVGTTPTTRSTAMATTTATDTTVATTTATAAPSIVPYVCVAGASQAIDWYADIFGAILTVRYDGDDGRVGHAEVSIEGATLYLSDEHPEIGVVGPRTLGGTAVSLHLRVGDVDAVHAAATAAGATSERPPADEPYGERVAIVVDPFGHRWFLQTPIGAPTLDEIAEAMPGYTITAGADAPATAGADAPASAAAAAPPVELGYFTISAPDTDRAARFYGALFGWETEQGNLGGDYRHVHNTALPLGVVPGPAEAAATLYYRVAELGPYVTKVAELGGRVVAETDYDSGRGADCVDDQGRPFQLWEPAPGY